MIIQLDKKMYEDGGKDTFTRYGLPDGPGARAGISWISLREPPWTRGSFFGLHDAYYSRKKRAKTDYFIRFFLGSNFLRERELMEWST